MNIFAVIVTYNGAAWINKCLSSIFDSALPVTVIVVDNGSTDTTLQIIQRNFNKVQLSVSSQNIGFGQANNIGIRKAYEQGAEHVLLLNQDAWLEKDTLNELVRQQLKYPVYGILSPMHLNGSGDSLDAGFENYLNSNSCPGMITALYKQSFKQEPYTIEFVNAACWLISKKCIETVGGFSPSFFHYGEDDNYIHRVTYHGLKTGVLPTVAVFHDRENRSSNSFTQDSYQQKKQLLVKFNNPITNFSLSDDIAIHKRNLLKATLFFQPTKAARIRIILQWMKEMEHDALRNREMSKKTGMTFL